MRNGQAQKLTATKASSGGHARLASNVAVGGRAVSFAETRPVRELMEEINQTEQAASGEGESVNELNSVFPRRANPNAPAQKDGALQTSFIANGHYQLNFPALNIPSPRAWV